ncbi:MAG TPA: sugar phosphate nucleotidyltransferase [Phycisphaerae bacterium]|nr:sugar phosphate nucleotidyltransferase [Phycisphaerae bacterium]
MTPNAPPTCAAASPATATRPKPAPTDQTLRDVVVVLMAGGFGTRFWPLGTAEQPKQFLTALAGRSLYRQAAERARAIVPWDRILVMTNAAHVGLVREQTPEVPEANVIGEPMRRDTAAAVILAALVAERRFPGSILVITPADHLVSNLEAFRRTVAAAVARARLGGLGTIGIRPTHPATGFGYLRLARRPGDAEAVSVLEFVEKPDAEQAARFVASGEYLWNAGMFIWKAGTLLEAARQLLPDVSAALEPLAESAGSPAFADRARQAFQSLRAISVDYGIMEKARDVWSVPALFDWSDVGDWLAASDLLPADADGNCVRGSVLLDAATGNIVVAGGSRPVLVVGVKNCVIVEGPGGTIVCDKSHAERIKPLVEKILNNHKNRDSHLFSS